MTQTEALERIACILALNSLSHIEAAKEYSSLKDNTQNVLRSNEEIADALEIGANYREMFSRLRS